MHKVLIIQTAYIGDVILGTPLIETIHLNFPYCKIDFMVKKGNENLLLNHPKLNKIYTLDKSKKYRSIFNNLLDIRKEKYDFVVNLHRFSSSGLIAGLSRANQVVGFKKNPFSWMFTQKIEHDTQSGQHEVDRNLSLLQNLCDIKITKPKLYPTNEHFNNVSSFTEKLFICLAPASVWKTKQAPVEKWLEIIKQYEDSFKIYLVGASTDIELCETIVAKTNKKNIENLCGKLSLMETAALFSKAMRVFVNDSGPLHIASAMNTPVTALFCSTIPEFGFGPLADDSKIIQVTNLPCRPCGLHGKISCPEGHFKCGNDLIIT